ncbi:tyrosine-type recombinase/integrase [Streptomyces sp. NPDC056821]|uniref:tyrosine-type recombinase/integrase n=1 Tax=unclassified Streptomyces TaxID=2593676 RepID=UPI003676F616
MRRSNFRDDWGKARKAAGVTAELHFHDLRHTGNALASTAGASTRELMTRMGHSSSRAALIYQQMTSDRDRAIADRRHDPGRWGSGFWLLREGPCGPVVARVWHGAWNGEGPAREGNPPELALSSVPPAGFEPATPALGVFPGQGCDLRKQQPNGVWPRKTPLRSSRVFTGFPGLVCAESVLAGVGCPGQGDSGNIDARGARSSVETPRRVP